jgi:retinol dehydrogenase 12
MAERYGDLIFEELKKDKPADMSDRYNTSKLLEVFFVRALVQEMQSGPHSDEKVVINTVNPGLCHSSLTRNISGVAAFFFEIAKYFLARSTECGSRTFVTAAESGEESHGRYMSECRVKEPSVFVRSEEGQKTQERTYRELMGIFEGIQPGIGKNI